MATMLRIMADHDVEGHVGVLIGIWTTPEWLDIWQPLGCGVESLATLGLPRNLPDSQVWSIARNTE